jgi:putative chitinase
MTKLSDHFTLEELTHSDTALQHHIENTPTDEHLHHMTAFLVPGLEHIRHICGDKPMSINDAYRNPTINKMVGGTATSAHPLGYAADFHVAGMTDLEVYRTIREAVRTGILKCDQLIIEDNRCVHASFDPRFRAMCGRQAGKAGTFIDWTFK